MKTIYENDFCEKLQYKIIDEIIYFYFIDADGNKTQTKKMSIDYLIGATF